MKKIIFPFATFLLLATALITIDAFGQETELPGEGKVDCYGRWTTGGTENFTQCNGCSIINNVSNPLDKSECRN